MRIFKNEYVNNEHYHFINSNLKQSIKLPFYYESFGKCHLTDESFCKRDNLFSYVLIITTKGNGTLEYRGRNFELEKGSVMFINAYDLHHYATKEGCKWEHFWFILNGSGVESYFNYIFEKDFFLINFEESNFEKIINLIKIIEKQILKQNGEIEMSNKINTLISKIAKAALKVKQLNLGEFFEIDQFILANIHRKIYAEELAKIMFISTKTLERRIFMAFETTISRYIINQRLKYAKSFLLNTTMSIEQISALVGISGAGRFIGYFKERYGETPFEYRKRKKNV